MSLKNQRYHETQICNNCHKILSGVTLNVPRVCSCQGWSYTYITTPIYTVFIFQEEKI